jgi:hypothetical protein
LDFENPAAFQAFHTDKVTVFSVTQTPGVSLAEHRLFSCLCTVMPISEQGQTGPQIRTQTGETFVVVIPAAQWASELKPAAGNCKIEHADYGMLHVVAVDRLGADWSLRCIGKAVRS